MSTSKHIDKICMSVTAIILVLTILFMNGKTLGLTASSKTMGYENRLFDTSTVHEIDIVMDDWDSFIENCESEEYSSCTVVIDGKKMSNIAIRAKGNTSLSNVSSLDSQRYSFKLEFDHYQDGNTYYGLDKLCLNNLIQDNTMMKDYIVYQMMNEFGVDSPLCSFVYITVNGEDWGLYLAVEGIEDSFLERNYNSADGNLYKPDSMSFGGGRGNGKDFSMDDFDFSGNSDDGSSSDSESSADENTSNAEDQSFGENSSDSGEGNAAGGFTPPGGMNFPSGNANPPSDSGSTESSADTSDSVSTESSSSDSSQGFGGFGGMPSGNFDPSTMTGGDFDPSTMASGDFDPSTIDTGDFGNMGGGFSGMGSDDVKLKYSDDDPDSYSNIFNNAKTDVTDSDKERLIESLKNLTNYTDLEETLDIEEVLRYFVIHTFTDNGDSYTGSMIHNYYLYEEDGQLSMIPWDYNLAFGTFTGTNASSSVNKSIDNPISSGSLDDRPMVGWIFSSDEYTNEYHELYSEFVSEWITSGKLTQMIDDTAEMISSYVEKDPTKFCTTEEFESGVAALREYCTLRGEAVENQLNGDDTAVDTGDLNLSDMGTMSTGGGGMGGNMPSMPGSTDGTQPTMPNQGDGTQPSIPDQNGGKSDTSSGSADESSENSENSDNSASRNEVSEDSSSSGQSDASEASGASVPDVEMTQVSESSSDSSTDQNSGTMSQAPSSDGSMPQPPSGTQGDGNMPQPPTGDQNGGTMPSAPAGFQGGDTTSSASEVSQTESESSDSADSSASETVTDQASPEPQAAAESSDSSQDVSEVQNDSSSETTAESSEAVTADNSDTKGSDKNSKGFSFSGDFSSFSPDGNTSGAVNSDAVKWIFVGVSALVLIVGLFIAIKKKPESVKFPHFQSQP